jgi:hypothetical protein
MDAPACRPALLVEADDMADAAWLLARETGALRWGAARSVVQTRARERPDRRKRCKQLPEVAEHFYAITGAAASASAAAQLQSRRAWRRRVCPAGRRGRRRAQVRRVDEPARAAEAPRRCRPNAR